MMKPDPSPLGRLHQHDALAVLLSQALDTAARQPGSGVDIAGMQTARAGGTGFASLAGEDVIFRNPHNIDAQVDIEAAVGLLEHFPLHRLPALEADHIGSGRHAGAAQNRQRCRADQWRCDTAAMFHRE